MDVKIIVKDEIGTFTVDFEYLRIERGIENPAQHLEVKFYSKIWRGEAIEIDFESSQYTQKFVVDEHVYTQDQNGFTHVLKGRSKTGFYLLENQVYPRSYENFTFEKLVTLVGAGSTVQGVKNGQLKSIPLFVIREGETIWDVFQNFALIAYGKKISLSEDGWIEIGTPMIQNCFYFSNSEDESLPYSFFRYEQKPKVRISQIRALDDLGGESIIANSEVKNMMRREYRRDQTIFSKASVQENSKRLIESLKKSYTLIIEHPNYFKGAPKDQVVIRDLNQNSAGWQIEKGVWEWRCGWKTTIISSLYRYREE